MKVYIIGLAIGVLYVGYSAPVHSQQSELDDSEIDVGWEYRITTGFEVEPAYTGSDKTISELAFDIRTSYQAASGHKYFLSLGEVGVEWRLGENTQLSTLLEYEFGRDNAEDPDLANFPIVEDTVEAQAVLSQRIGDFIVGIGMQQDIRNRGKGLVGFLGAAYQRKLSERFGVHTTLDLSFADAEHMQTEVGISAATAAITGYDSYTAPSGYKGVSATIGFEYALTKQWKAISEIGVESYGPNMSDSPLIKAAGTSTTFEAAVGIQYTF